MGANDTCQFILERINVPHTIVLDQPEHTYTCGRAKDNQIICHSLTVSRRHCIFFRSKNELYVTDLKSANGLFINGIPQEPFQTTKLYPNDVIGIGCPNVDITDNIMYAYKLHAIAQPQIGGENQSIDTFSETVLNFENTCSDKSDNIIKRKREEKNQDIKILPSKIPKLEGESCILEKNSLKEKCKTTDENDIEIIHVSLNSSLPGENDKNCNFTKKIELNNKLNVKDHIDINMYESSSNINNTKIDTSMVNKVEPDELINCEYMVSPISNSVQRKANKKEISVTHKSKKESQEIQNHTENDLLHTKGIESSISNFYNFESKNIVKNNNAEINFDLKNNSKENTKGNNTINNTINEIKKPNSVNKANEFIVENNSENLSLLPLNFVHNEYGMIKMEDELQLTDTDEKAILNSSNTNLVPFVSPIKLKKIQEEPKTKFSEDDVVNLSDSEDDIFPCSQLFDVGYGMNTSIKDEIKEEPIEAENEGFGIVDDADLVISLTDSEDEDNNWLHRLSRSQILNENDEIDVDRKNDIKKENIYTETVDIEKTIPNKFELNNDIKINIDDEKEAEKSTNREQNTLLQGVKNLNKIFSSEGSPERMEVDFEDHTAKLVETSNDISSTKKHSVLPKNQSLLPMHKETENDINTLSDNKAETTSTKKKKLLEKKVPQIEPPHLPTRRRSNSSKQKNRKVIHKWADCLPPRKKRSGNLSKEEKKALSDSRKMKLKKLAMDEKQTSLDDNHEKKRIVSKPKAKITAKTRNDFLVEETISATKSENVTEKSKTTSSRSASANDTSPNFKITNSSKHKNISKEITMHLQHKLTLNDISSLGKIPKISSTTKIKANTAEAEAALKDLSLEKKVDKVIEMKDSELKSKSNTESLKSIEKESLVPFKSNIKSPIPKSKKRVSFSAVIQTVREYEIDELNVLKKITGKDAPIPLEKVAVKKPRNIVESNAKCNHFLWRILCWNPVWLEVQQYLNQDAPVIQPEELNVMLTHYKSYDEYYKIISPLLLLEIWHGITKEFQSTDHKYKRPTFMCSVVENSIQTNIVPNNIFFTTLMLEILATEEDIRRQIHPVYGDLVFFEYAQNHNKGQSFYKVFAYVTNVYSTVLTPLTRFNKDLQHYVKNPYTLLTYTVTTKHFDKSIPVNRVQRLRAVVCLRPSLRMVQALQYLPNSPLVNLIISPKLEMYQLPIVSELETLITGDKLNQKQLEAVSKVTKAVVQKDTKLCFIQGPPGTGKSKVIVNIVTQILYGNNRYTNNGSSFKMLVCAPSNAAIDEIVLRLLHIRAGIKQKAKIKPFKMVRIGRSEMMHPTVKDISVTELAKRDIRKTGNTSNISSDSIENEKLLLQSKMNALQCELTNSHSVDEVYKQHIRMKLAEMATKYELLKNRRSSNEINEKSKENMRLQRTTENRILEHADIITCTLSSCYTSQMESIFGINKKRISVCIVDEATQSCEAESLIPLMLGINILILVGDPNQLPATILSTQAKKYGLDQSIFSRVQNAFELQPNNPIIMLDTQYRMQPDISSWPNKFFYGGKLKNATKQEKKFPFYAYRILNLNTNQNNDNSNDGEADFVANIIYCMLTFADLDNWESYISCGILTPYNNQKSVILTKISEK
ncbi:putative helicase senataxin [Eufriesea mexicana]|uniref:Putative helicase senataxin n=1 Tax=Eufriesea mexicana TaxID=516756 RepID=A0A310SG30_9HYME|nr:putative helicase senataxin [Eufriesea mexicana]